jgi:oxygen-independent coproporphyrinogen-3 oxidase
VRAGEMAIAKGHAFSGDDMLRGRIIEKLLCDFRADLNAIAKEQGVPVSEAVALVDGLEAALPGTTTLIDGVLTINKDSHILARLIARHFDAYEMSAAGHSQAV